MSTRTLRILCCLLCLALAPYAGSLAQEGGDHDRDHPGAGGGPGGPGGLGSPGGPRETRGSEHNKGGAVMAPQRNNALHFGPVGRWWDDKKVIQTLGLRREQQKRMDVIFDSNKPAILDSYKGFLKAQADLNAVNKNPQASKDQVFAAIDAVNQARASLQKATSAMLLQIRKEMDPSQVNKLETIP
jgi:hypothetical protein